MSDDDIRALRLLAARITAQVPELLTKEQKRLLHDAQMDDRIDEWHAGKASMTLHQYLGMSKEEYARWLEEP